MRRPCEAATPQARPRAGEPAAPRLMVLSDVRLLRAALVHTLSRAAGVDIVGAAELDAVPGEIARHRPDALLIDARCTDALEAVPPLRAILPGLHIVAFGIAEASEAIVDWAQAGAAGFVAPSASAEDVVTAVQAAMRGELACSPRAAGFLLDRLRALAAPRAAAAPDRAALTQREREVAQLMGDGLANKQIARRLGIQSATVKNHVHSVLAKLHLSRRGEVAARLAPRPRRLASAIAGHGVGRDIESLAAA